MFHRSIPLLFASAVLLAAPAASAQQCTPDAVGCDVAGTSGSCVADAEGELVCLASPLGACRDLEPGTPCDTLVADGGRCEDALGLLLCVPLAGDAECAGQQLGVACTVDDSAGGCALVDGQLLCVAGPCPAAALNTGCELEQGGSGWCRPSAESGYVPVCTTDCFDRADPCLQDGGAAGFCRPDELRWECVDESDLDMCMSEDAACTRGSGDPGICKPTGEAGGLDCVPDSSQCIDGCCDEGDACETASGEVGRCRITGGAGGLECAVGDAEESDGGDGCCGGEPLPSMRPDAIGAFGAGLAAVVARRRRRGVRKAAEKRG